MKNFKMIATTFTITILSFLVLSGCGNRRSTPNQPLSSLPTVNESTGDGEASSIIESDIDLSTDADDETMDSPVVQMENAVLQYPSQNETWKYNVYDCYVEITGYVGSDGSNVEVPEEIENLPVWKIGDSALRDSNIISIKLPNCLVRIGARAFANSQIENIDMPQELHTIGQGAFYGCSKISTIKIPQGVIGIAKEAFNGCENLSEITLPEGLAFIDESAFSKCTSLSSITVPESVTYIGPLAFAECTSLYSIHVPAGVEEIGQGTFENCTSLSQVLLEEGLKSIGNAAFQNCKELKSIILPASVISIGTNEWNIPLFAGVADNFNLTVLNSDMIFYARIFDSRENKILHGYSASTAAQYCAKYDMIFQVIE